MVKKTFLKLLVICLLVGYTQQAKPMEAITGLILITATPIGAMIAGVAVAGIGLTTGIGYGIYSFARPYTENELLQNNILVIKELEKYQELLDLIITKSVTAFTSCLKNQKITNQKKLNKFLFNLKKHSANLEYNISRFDALLVVKEQKKETLGVYDIKEAITNAKLNLKKLDAIESFIGTNKTAIINSLKA
ncbi:MAG: hypothetical protein P4L22_03885 [Candidatus Babeliales bacterium]|nr:hypothetical protein [Candidatus Babeliales bacterium]